MSTLASFPLPFKSVRRISDGKQGPYIVGAMFTANYSKDAERLAASCEKCELPYVIYEVPTVHRSTHSLGSNDLSCTKPNFIHHLLVEHGKPVLYLDADCEFMSEPDLVGELVRSGCDFAIYNWLAEEYTDTFIPVELGVGPDGPPLKSRFYRYWRSVDWYATSQLICSGLVQFYGNSDAARFLLGEWHQAIASFPLAADDLCLTYAFNNMGTRADELKVRWLPKAYARISWWIYVKPVINHKAKPQSHSKFADIEETAGKKAFYASRAELRNVPCLFPRDCIIDTERRLVCRIVGDQLVTIRPAEQVFWT